MTPGRRAGGAGAIVALSVVVALWFSPMLAATLPRQEPTAEIVEVGAGPIGDRSFGFVGRTIYGTESVRLFGYLTGVLGLDAGFSYTGGAPSPETSRFTYSGEAAIADQTNRGDVTEISGTGTLRIYVDDAAGASWDAAGSFADGQPVAEFALLLFDTVQRQAPGVGVVVGDERLEQLAAEEFTIDGQRFRFGNAGIAGRMRYSGALAGSADDQAPVANHSGFASVTARGSMAVRLGATPPPATVSSSCAALEPWLGQTTAVLAEAQALAAQIDVTLPVEELDADALLQKADDLNALAAAQRERETPEDAADANRLTVTALSTLARAVQTIATAAAESDADLLGQGQAVLGDGDALIGRAGDAVGALAGTC